MRRKTVAHRMDARVLRDPGLLHRHGHYFLNRTGADVVATHLACPGINGKRSGGKGILPSPFLACVYIFTVKAVRKIYFAMSHFQIFFMKLSYPGKMLLQAILYKFRHNSHSILISLACSDNNGI